MIVDDFAVFRKQIVRLPLWRERGDFEISGEAGDGDEALAKLRADRYELLITDIKMPKMTGIELLEVVVAENLCRCVALLSEYTDFEDARRGLVLGAFDYIIKPIDAEKMHTLLTRCSAYLISHKEDDYPNFEEKSIIQAILAADPEIGSKIERLTASIHAYTNRDLVKMGVMMLRLTQNAYQGVVSAEPWIKGLIKDVDRMESTLLKYDQYIMLNAALEEYIREMFIAISTFRLGKSDLVKQACRYILEHSDQKISLEDVASACFTNHTYLSHIFKVETGMTFSDYLTELKCARAKKLLRETALKIFEVARQLGFEDPEYFSRCFKGCVGETPTEYKKRQQI
jgi:two-component system response regulator YesN